MSVLEVSALSKSFGGVHALDGVDVHGDPGEIVAIIGPNGSGKTTLVNCVTGTLRPDSGRVVIDGVNVTGRSASVVTRSGIARTFQAPRPFSSMSVLENALTATLQAKDISMDDAKVRALQALSDLGLRRFAEAPVSALTLVQRKRLDMARALALQPRVLWLDEVMSGLNPTEMDEGIDAVRQIADRGVLVFYIEHVMRTVTALCERCFVLNQGKLIASGTTRDVLTDERVVAAYLGRGSNVKTQ